LSTSKKPALAKGWMRALIFLVVFTGVYVSGNYAYSHQHLVNGLLPVYSNTIIFTLATLITVPLFRVAVDRQSLSSLGFRKLSGSPDAALGLLFPIAILGIGTLVLYFNGNLEFDGYNFSWRDVLMNLVLMLFIAAAEETVFRGYILNNLLDSFNHLVALFCSAVIFAMLHAGNPDAGIVAVINVFLAGLVLGIGYTITRNLWFPFVFHLAWNFFQGPVLGFPVSGLTMQSVISLTVSGDQLMTGGRFGFEASLIETVLYMLALTALYFYYFRPEGLSHRRPVKRN
jgi:CAAX protease family protein